jgi:ferredoxin
MCPDVFGFDDDKGVAFIKDPYGADEEAIEEAIDSCPASCIHWDAN